MRRILVSIALLAATSASVSPAQVTDTPPAASEMPAMAILQQVANAPTDTARLELVDRALVLLVQPTAFRGQILCARAALLEQMDRSTEARAGFDQCRLLRPNDPNVLLPIAFDESRRQRPVEAARLLIRAASLRAAALDGVDSDLIATILRQLYYAKQDDVANELVTTLVSAGYPRDNPVVLSDYVRIAILSRLRAGDTAGATQLLPSILSPGVGIGMLIDRQFAPIWPAIEQWAGDDLSIQRRALVSAARAAFETSGSAAARNRYAAALVETGHRDDAIDLIDQWLSTSYTPDEAWDRNRAILQQGRWLAGQGQRAEGIKRMRAALERPPGANAGTENIVPNLIRQMLLARDYAGAMDLLDHRTPDAAHMESPAAMGYFVSLRACALEGLSKHTQAVAELNRVRTQYAGVAGAQGAAIACVGSIDEQAQWWLQKVREKDHTATLTNLAAARYAKANKLPADSIEEIMLQRIENRPDVRQAYLENARDLPERYAPGLDDFNTAPLPPRRTAAPLSAT